MCPRAVYLATPWPNVCCARATRFPFALMVRHSATGTARTRRSRRMTFRIRLVCWPRLVCRRISLRIWPRSALKRSWIARICAWHSSRRCWIRITSSSMRRSNAFRSLAFMSSGCHGAGNDSVRVRLVQRPFGGPSHAHRWGRVTIPRPGPDVLRSFQTLALAPQPAEAPTRREAWFGPSANRRQYRGLRSSRALQVLALGIIDPMRRSSNRDSSCGGLRDFQRQFPYRRPYNDLGHPMGWPKSLKLLVGGTRIELVTPAV